jgi:hypothetical protein
MRANSTDELDSLAADDARLLYLACGIVLAASFACSLYASIGARGLYADAAALLVVIYERGGLYFVGTRAVVDLLRETPIILLSRYSSASLFECGQAFTFVMLIWPTLLAACCWFIAPLNRKTWILFPLASLLIGFAATSTHAIGEAAIATSYYWILLFVLLFKTRSAIGQALFLCLCIPAFELHEGAFPLTGILLFAIVMRAPAAAGQLRFARLAIAFLAAIFLYQIYYVIHPNFPGDREHILTGLAHFEFLYADEHFNLPIVTGAVALLALTAVFVVHISLPAEKATRLANAIAVAWGLVALTAIVIAATTEQSFAPYSQIQARYHPVIVSTALGAILILLLRFGPPHRAWMNPATVSILICLCAAQVTADVRATQRWNEYIADLQSRLVNGHGLIPWETTLHTDNERADTNWRIFKIEWVIPYMCVDFAPNGVVNTMIDLPKGLTFRPLDPEKLDRLPKLRGIDFGPYKRFLIEQKSGS